MTSGVLPAEPDALLDQGWRETSHPEAARFGHRSFEHPRTGDVLRFYKGKQGLPGFEGRDHYHRYNPSRFSRADEYLDAGGRPVAPRQRGIPPVSGNGIRRGGPMTMLELRTAEPVPRTGPSVSPSVSFHDSTILSIHQQDNRVELQFDDVQQDGRAGPLRVAVTGFDRLFRDGHAVDAIGMEAADGEVLTFDRKDDRVVLVVEWNDFALRWRETRVYEFVPGSAGLRVISVD